MEADRGAQVEEEQFGFRFGEVGDYSQEEEEEQEPIQEEEQEEELGINEI